MLQINSGNKTVITDLFRAFLEQRIKDNSLNEHSVVCTREQGLWGCKRLVGISELMVCSSIAGGTNTVLLGSFSPGLDASFG